MSAIAAANGSAMHYSARHAPSPCIGIDIVDGRQIETELKLKVRRHDLDVLRQGSRLSDALNNATSHQVRSIYFDSDDRFLHRHGVVLRVRRRGDHYVQTVKSTGPEGDWLNRSEWEQKIASSRLDFVALMETPLGSALSDAVRASLKPIFETRIERTSCLWDTPTAAIELSLDKGEIIGSDKTLPVTEIELELKRGHVAEVFKLARDIGAVVPVEIEVKSKSERGYELVDHAAACSERFHNPRLAADTPAGAAFTAIGRACMRHLLVNEAGTLTRDAEALHQVRVALRRLRAAISLFRDVVADDRLEAVKTELKWMAQEIGPARDLDVFIAEALTPLRRLHPKEAALADIGKLLGRMRLKSYRDVHAMITSARFRNSLLDVAEWLEVGTWTTSQDVRIVAARDQPVRVLAARQLSRLRKKIRRHGEGLRKLDPEQLHRLRIEIKKARYAIDFFGDLYAGDKAERRRKKMQVDLTQLQDRLGGLNDIEMRKAMCRQVLSQTIARRTPERVQHRAFAAGLIVGDQQAKRHDLFKRVRKAMARFDNAKPFWTVPRPDATAKETSAQ
jgi:inorganic triphosphatase YgiF